MIGITTKLTQKNCYPGANKPAWIVIHETANEKAGALQHAKAAGNGNISTVHYYVDDSYIVQTLRHIDGAWAVGKQYGTPLVPGVTNKNSINIEICVNTQSNYNTAVNNTIDLVKHLIKITGIPASKVIRHYDAKRKYCPRKMMDTPGAWEAFKKAITAQEVPQKNGWAQESGRWYYYQENKRLSGWLKDKDKWYYLNPGGAMVAGDWTLQGGKWYYLDQSGMMRVSWIQHKNRWHLLGRDGAMLTGWQQDKDKWYYLNSPNGDMAVNTTTPDGYKVGPDGAWIEE